MQETYYGVLEIEETATQEEIKSAFRTLVKRYHPDNIETGNEQEFKKVMEAYEVLSNLEKRKKYDSSLRKSNSTYNDSPDNESTTSKTSGKNQTYHQYASYTKTKEEMESDFDNLIKNILRKYRKSQERNLTEKENFIHLNKSYYNYLKHFYTKQEWDEKEENISYTKVLKK